MTITGGGNCACGGNCSGCVLIMLLLIVMKAVEALLLLLYSWWILPYSIIDIVITTTTTTITIIVNYSPTHQMTIQRNNLSPTLCREIVLIKVIHAMLAIIPAKDVEGVVYDCGGVEGTLAGW